MIISRTGAHLIFKITTMRLHRTQTVQTARAVAEKTRLKGKAEARALAAVGEAEATKMRLKANAYQRFVQLFEYFVSRKNCTKRMLIAREN